MTEGERSKGRRAGQANKCHCRPLNHPFGTVKMKSHLAFLHIRSSGLLGCPVHFLPTAAKVVKYPFQGQSQKKKWVSRHLSHMATQWSSHSGCYSLVLTVAVIYSFPYLLIHYFSLSHLYWFMLSYRSTKMRAKKKPSVTTFGSGREQSKKNKLQKLRHQGHKLLGEHRAGGGLRRNHERVFGTSLSTLGPSNDCPSIPS